MARHRADDDQSEPENPAARDEDRLADGLAWPLSSEKSRCPCGAHAEVGRLCAKCRARVAWAQRCAHRDRPDSEHGPRHRRRSGASRRPESDRPHQRRPRGRRPER
jgi:hypothetical protein